MGSSPLIKTDANALDGDTDLDVVLLSNRPCGIYDCGPSLLQIWTALRNSPEMQSLDVQYVNANVPLVKVTSQKPALSIDLLWLSGVSLPTSDDDDDVGILPTPPLPAELTLQPRTTHELDSNDAHVRMVIEPGGVSDRINNGSSYWTYAPDSTLAEAAGDIDTSSISSSPNEFDDGGIDCSGMPPPEYTPPPVIHHYEVTDERVRLPANGGGAADAIRLSRLLVGALGQSAHFTTAAILSLRRWAKARHLYGSKYGYPGGSAWTVTGLRTDGRERPVHEPLVMLWSFCVYLDRLNAKTPMSTDETLWRFFLVLALWPWPLPFTVRNMDAVAGAAVSMRVCVCGYPECLIFIVQWYGFLTADRPRRRGAWTVQRTDVVRDVRPQSTF